LGPEYAEWAAHRPEPRLVGRVLVRGATGPSPRGRQRGTGGTGECRGPRRRGDGAVPGLRPDRWPPRPHL